VASYPDAGVECDVSIGAVCIIPFCNVERSNSLGTSKLLWLTRVDAERVQKIVVCYFLARIGYWRSEWFVPDAVLLDVGDDGAPDQVDYVGLPRQANTAFDADHFEQYFTVGANREVKY
jgi:hypothetical protein